jgi:hypothetical protein
MMAGIALMLGIQGDAPIKCDIRMHNRQQDQKGGSHLHALLTRV